MTVSTTGSVTISMTVSTTLTLTVSMTVSATVTATSSQDDRWLSWITDNNEYEGLLPLSVSLMFQIWRFERSP